MHTILPTGALPDQATLGGKGYALYRLSNDSFQIPAWFVVGPDFFHDSAPAEETLETALREHAFSDHDLNRLREALSGLSGNRFAVRSSAVDEDGTGASFAGQLDSFLNVPPGEVPEKILAVWQSILSPRLTVYRRENHLPPPTRVPAVLVQRMVAAEAAGVAFSADVVSGRRAVAVVSAVRGLGEKLVSGEADADTWRIDRDDRIVEFTPAGPDAAHPSIDEATVRAVAALARRCERHFGRPQDIEWALEAGELYLLQSRPITTLACRADPDGVLNIWDNSNIAESYGGVTTPLTYTFAHYIYSEVYRQFCRIMHVAEDVVEDNRAVFNSMLGLVRGRVYYNLMSWYRMLALLPGFRFNRRFMEQMMGVKEGLPAAVLAGLEDNRLGARLRDAGRLAWALLGLIRAQWRLPAMIRRFHAHFDTTLAAIPRPLEELRADELIAHFHRLEEQLLSRWDAPLVNDFFAMIYFGLLRSLTEKWCDDKDGTLQNGLLCGTGAIISAEPARRIHEMARLAARDPAWTDTLLEADLVCIRSSMTKQPKFSAAYQAYLDRFADRCLNELKLESPTLRDDPLPLLRSVGNLARRLREGNAPAAGVEQQLRETAARTLAARLRGRPLRRLVFNYVLKNARRRVRDRENLRFERTRLFGRIRSLFLECGHRLAAVGALDDPRDVFFLELREIVGFIEGTGSTTDLKGLVRIRREEFEGFRSLPPPADRFETRGMVAVGNTFEPPTRPPTDAHADGGLRGLGCCPGIVRGPVRVVTDPTEARLQRGEILVAEQTDPGWITLFPAAAGVLVQRGSLLSHSAIVSREMGIPAIVSVSGLLAGLRTGDWVEFDGTTGMIRKLESPEA
ncbi:MAG: phosphoenolpyruvate synthase [Puniceicoccaceae bacterium]|nr:MAG: phosphoenolpyruvate synthase [Puniceicoccaceae bacterium]